MQLGRLVASALLVLSLGWSMPVALAGQMHTRVAREVESPVTATALALESREGDKVLDTKELILRSSEQQHIELTFQAKEAGARYLTVNVPVQPEEPKELHVIEIDTMPTDSFPRSIQFEILNDVNCGYRGLEPGVPRH